MNFSRTSLSSCLALSLFASSLAFAFPALSQEAVDGEATGFVSPQVALQSDLSGFTTQTDVAVGQTIQSNTITLSDLGGATVSLSVAGDGSPSLVVDGGAPTSNADVSGGETLLVEITTAADDYGSTYLATVTGDNGASGTFEITTPDNPPVDGHMIVGTSAGTLLKINPNDMTVLGSVSLGSARLTDIAKGDGTTLFVADQNLVIYKVDSDSMTSLGSFATGQGISYGVPKIAYYDGHVYYGGDQAVIFKLDAATMASPQSGNLYNFSQGLYYDFLSVELGPDNNLYVGSFGRIVKVNPSSLAKISHHDVTGKDILDIDFGSNGALYAAAYSGDAALSGVYKYDYTTMTEQASYTGLPRYYPYTVRAAGDGSVYTKSNNTVYKLDSNLNLVTTGSTDYQYALSFDANGTVYDGRWSRLYKMAPDTLADGASVSVSKTTSALYLDSFQASNSVTLLNGLSYEKNGTNSVSIASGGSGNYSLSVGGDTIPGVSVVDGYFNGTPTTNGSYSVTYTVTDTGSGASYSGTATVTVSSPPTPNFMSFRESGDILAFSGTSYNPINLQVPVINETVSYTVSGDLPTGITYNESSSTFSGTASGYGSNTLYQFPVTITATNDYGVSSTKNMQFRICRQVGTNPTCSSDYNRTLEANDPNRGQEYELRQSGPTTVDHAGGGIGSVVPVVQSCTDNLGGTTKPSITHIGSGTLRISYQSTNLGSPVRWTCRYVFQNSSGDREQTTFRVWYR